MKKILNVMLCMMIMSVAKGDEVTDSLQDIYELEHVVVSASGASTRINDVRLGTERIELSTMKSGPHMFGEPDMVKTIILMPGVHSEGEGTGGFEVRGATAAQNLILLDGMTLYNPSHVMGVFSTFNTEAIGGGILYKGPIPACFGGATSSVLDAWLQPGNMNEFSGSATLGLLTAKIFASVPVVKDKFSVALSARRSYPDMYLKLSEDYKNTVLHFYDVTFRGRCVPSNRDAVDLSFIKAGDNLAINDVMGMKWGNVAGALKWTHSCGDNLRFTSQASYTSYSPCAWTSVLGLDQTMRTYIRDLSTNVSADVFPNDYHTLHCGARLQYLQVMTGEFQKNSSKEKEVRRGLQNSCWVNYLGELSYSWRVDAGVRFSFFDALSGHEFMAEGDEKPLYKSRLHFDTEFRINVMYRLSETHTLKIGIGDVTQNLHALRSSATSLPFERYTLTSASVLPERSFQLGAGYAGMSEDGTYDWSAELFHRDYKNVYEYADGYNTFSSIDLESIILKGERRSCGAEFLIRKNRGSLTGWVSYTISKSRTRVPGINSGRWYDANSDRLHDFNITAMYEFNSRWKLSASWIYTSGAPLTAPDAKYQLAGRTCYYYSTRNGYRAPSTHHLDISATYRSKGRRFDSEISLGIYNLYNQYNPYIIYFEDDSSKPSGTRAVQQSLYGLLPSISYTIRIK